MTDVLLECRIILVSFILLGVCSLDDRVYCIGGTYGPSGTKYCFRLNESESKWDRIANLQQGKKYRVAVIIIELSIKEILH